jgi:hypothetical protein
MQLAQVITQAIEQISQSGPQQQQGQQQQGVDPQGIFDSIGKFLSGAGQQVIETVGPTIVHQAEGWLSGLLSSLANEPQFQQQIRSAIASGQVSGVNPQSIFGDAFNWFKQNIPVIAKEAAPYVIKVLPNILATLASQPQQPGQMQQPGQVWTQGAQPQVWTQGAQPQVWTKGAQPVYR